MKYRKFDEKITIDPADVLEVSHEHDRTYPDWAGLSMVTRKSSVTQISVRYFKHEKTTTPIWDYLAERLGEKKAHQFLQTLNDLDAKGLL